MKQDKNLKLAKRRLLYAAEKICYYSWDSRSLRRRFYNKDIEKLCKAALDFARKTQAVKDAKNRERFRPAF